MADYKTPYSAASSHFVESAPSSEEELRAHMRSLKRKEKHADKWAQNSVNINEVIDRFAPGARGVTHGVKYIYKGQRYNVVADMSSGYLRIWDTQRRCWVTLDGVEDKSGKHSHYRIKKRGEL